MCGLYAIGKGQGHIYSSRIYLHREYTPQDDKQFREMMMRIEAIKNDDTTLAYFYWHGTQLSKSIVSTGPSTIL